MIRLDSPKGPPATVDSIAMGADYWYVSTSSYAGAPSAHCVSRAPRAGGVLEDVWCPSFMVLSLVSVNGMLAGLNPWPWTDDPGPWAVDASGHARAVARSGKDRQSLGLRADPRGRRLYTVERYPGNGIQPATSDLLQFDVGSGQRTVLDHLEDPARHGWFFADAQSVFFTRGGEILRMEP